MRTPVHRLVSAPSRDPVADATEPETDVDLRPDENLVRVRFRGTFTADEWLAALDGVVADPGYRPGMNVLHDLRDAKLDIPPTGVGPLLAELRSRVDRWGEGWRYGLVVADPLTYGLSRVGTTWFGGAPFEISVFRDADQAERWVRRG